MKSDKQTLQATIQRINELYIMQRSKHIVQNNDGTYYHVKAFKLKDSDIKNHLLMKKTIGFFAGEIFTKCLIFDVDFKNDLEKAKQVTRNLVFTLEQEFYIKKEQMLVNFSGGKGYHLAIFFDKVIELEKAKQFYNLVIDAVGCNTHQIELRPTFGSGVKLPLSIHRKTGQRCHLVNPNTLYEASDEELFNVEQVNADNFLDYLSEFEEEEESQGVTLSKKQGQEFENVVETTNLEIPVDYNERCMTMLEENSLIYENSRHTSTLLLLIFLKEQGYDPHEAVQLVNNIIANTFAANRSLIDQDTTEDFALGEVKRLSVHVYRGDYKLGDNVKTSIQIYKNEILEVLEPKQIHLKQLAFIMLLHSKKYANKNGEFYMTYKQMSEYGATTERVRLLKQLLKLEEEGLIEIVERDKKKKGRLHLLPNRYKVKIVPTTIGNFIKLESANLKQTEFKSVVTQLILQDELKEIVSTKQYYTHFKTCDI